MKKLSLLFLVAALSISAFSAEKADAKAGASVTESKKVDMANIDAITSASIVPAAIVKEYIPKGFTGSKAKKALFIIGDPRHNSVTFDMAYTAMKFFEENGIEVTLRDLYAMKWNPVLSFDEFYYQKDGIGTPTQDVAEEQKLVTQADYIIFVYPNWHDSATSIVKGYQERVFAKEFAYTADNNGLRGLLKGKGLFTMMNCGFLGGGREALNAPNIILPSIIACGLNHVTTQAVVTTFIKGIFTSVEFLREPFAFTRPIPI